MKISEISKQIFYHGTTADKIPVIQRKGLLPGSDGVVWLTKDRDTAYYNGAMRQWIAGKHKSQPVVITVELKFRPDSTDFGVPYAIPPVNIVDIGLTTDEQDDYEYSRNRLASKSKN